MSFRLKIILGITATQALLLWVLVASSLEFLRSAEELGLQKYTSVATGLFASATRNAVLSTDLAALEGAVAEALRNPDIDYARVLDERGVLAQAGSAPSLARSFHADQRLQDVQHDVYNTSADIKVNGKRFGRVELGFSVTAIKLALQKAHAQAVAIATVATAIALLLSFFLALYLCRRLNLLTRGARRLAEGELGYQIAVQGKDELAQTGLAFNNMSRQLQLAEHELKEQQNRLEQLVAQRTDELARANAGLRHSNRELEQTQRQLTHAAYYDSLTSLPNRSLMLERLKQCTALARRNNQRITVVFIDLDRFKVINDSLGHKAGDLLLQHVAARLTACIRESDTAARLGGDEFVLLLVDQSDENQTLNVLRRILDEISRPFQLPGHQIHSSCSIGCAVFPDDSEDTDSLLKLADTAMYRAKEAGKNNYQFFMPEMQSRINERLLLEAELRTAIARSEFVLFYHPQVNIRSGEICGVEALIRWRHPERGLVSPLEFIPVAEDIGLIHEIGEWVLREACRQCVHWQNAGYGAIPMAVNLSIKQFLQDDIAPLIAKVIADTHISPDLLELELTESLSTDAPQQCIEVMHKLKGVGVKLAIDDFGTGYSNLSYLKQFPIDRLKIDRAFVKDITSSPEDLAISTCIIAMAHSLDVRVIAEGVETLSQLELLTRRNCDEFQGYYFSKPLPAAELEQFLQQRIRIAAPAGSPHYRKPSVLFVDDEEMILNAIRRRVGKDYPVLTCGSPKEALELLATERIAVLVSDQKMPSGSGAELLRNVKKMYPDVVRILLTGAQDLSMLEDAVNKGEIFRFLTKPWEDKTLKAILAAAFEKHEAHTRQDPP